MFAASPIYYQVPVYRALAARPEIDFQAIFGSSEGVRPFGGGFGQPVKWDVDLLSGYRSTFVRKAETNPMGGGFWGQRAADLPRLVTRLRPEVLWVHGYNSAAHVMAALAQRVAGRQLLFREEQTLLHERPFWKDMIKRIGLPLFTRGTRGLYISSQNRAWFRDLGMADSRLFFTPYCVDNSGLRAEGQRLRPKRGELREGFGITEASGPVILTLSRLVKKKQPLAVLRAFSKLRERRQCTLLIAGSGPEEGLLREFVSHHRVPDVIFAGFLPQSEIARAYVAADIFALFSKEHETFGLVVNEAMNFSLPVVISDMVGSGYDLVEHGYNGFVVPWESESGLGHALERLVDDSALRKSLGERGLQKIAEWNYDITVKGIVDAVADAVGPQRWARATGGSLAASH